MDAEVRQVSNKKVQDKRLIKFIQKILIIIFTCCMAAAATSRIQCILD